MQPPETPRTVRIVAGFLFAATVIAAFVGAGVLFPNRLTERLWELNKPGAALFRAIGPISGLFLLALAAGTAAAAVGLLRRRKWAWWFAMALFAIDSCGDVVAVFVTGDWLRTVVGVAVSSAFLYALTRAHVRSYFGAAMAHPANHST